MTKSREGEGESVTKSREGEGESVTKSREGEGESVTKSREGEGESVTKSREGEGPRLLRKSPRRPSSSPTKRRADARHSEWQEGCRLHWQSRWRLRDTQEGKSTCFARTRLCLLTDVHDTSSDGNRLGLLRFRSLDVNLRTLSPHPRVTSSCFPSPAKRERKLRRGGGLARSVFIFLSSPLSAQICLCADLPLPLSAAICR